MYYITCYYDKKNIFDFTYTINKIPVCRVQCMNDLFVSAARDMLWNSLLNTLVSKCSIMMGRIKIICWLESSYNGYILLCTVHLFAVILNTVLVLYTRYILNYPHLKYNERYIPQNIRSIQSLFTR